MENNLSNEVSKEVDPISADDRESAIEDAIIKLDRVHMFLNHWLNLYSFSDKPDPVAALNWSSSSSTVHEKQSAKWYEEYENILGFVDSAFDYVIEAREILKRTI